MSELKLDLGCGPNKQPGFTGVDQIKFENVDVVHDLRKKWPWKTGSVDEVHSSHFIEHLGPADRRFFVNELYRVLKPGGKATLVAPHWSSGRAYGDLTHQWPPIADMWFLYLNKEWRAANAPHDDISRNKDGYSCDFDATWGYSTNPAIQTRDQNYQQHAISYFREAIMDIHATLTSKKEKK